MRGFGRVYKRKGSKYWWVGYNVAGREYRESSKSVVKDDAKNLLRLRLEQYRLLPGAPPPRITIKQGFEEYIEDAERRGVRAIGVLRKRAAVVIEEIGHVKLDDVSPLLIREVQGRLASRYGPATVNVTVRCFGAMMGHAARSGMILQRPAMPRPLREPPPRSGFLEHVDFVAIRGELAEPARSVFHFAYFSGWRRSEILRLRWSEVRFDEGVVVLSSAASKNREERTLPIRGEIERLLREWASARRLDCAYVFHSAGRRLWESRLNAQFRAACNACGRIGVLFHDARRTTVRNLVRAGVPERVAMDITGHRSRSVFERYNITSREDLDRATDALNEYVQGKDLDKPGEVVDFSKKRG